ncbi:MAG: Neutral/alkaline non-lysosomal ceramidase [Lentisphaerae bacterium ADurb.Bin242]|nr:MAG: Neutral/alkaline non-lysosomal ceramidase [Lentisphaerae bacterium ADurb.Bin242]
MKAGFAVRDITPRIGVELLGYGPYIHRSSTWVRDPLEARAAAFELGGHKCVIIACDLAGFSPATYEKSVALIREKHPELEEADIFICASHTHTGPAWEHLGDAWGVPDPVYIALLSRKIAAAGLEALEKLESVNMAVAVVPCEGIGLNRVSDKFNIELEDCLKEGWRPDKPELTETKATVLRFEREDGSLAGFFACFAAHPVVCGQSTHISGDFPAIAIHSIMRTFPGSVGLFLQGAQGDVNPCAVGHKDKNKALLALDVIAGRFERVIRIGLAQAQPVDFDTLGTAKMPVAIATRPVDWKEIGKFLDKQQAILENADAEESARNTGMAVAYLDGHRRFKAFFERNQDGFFHVQIHGVRLGPVTLFGAPFEMFQAIKNEIVAKAKALLPVVVSLTDAEYGYAPDRNADMESYEAKLSPMVCGIPQYLHIHDDLVKGFLELESRLSL